MDLASQISRSLSRAPGRQANPGRGVRLSMFDMPLSLPRHETSQRLPARDRTLLSIEVELGGMAVEFKARNLVGLLAWLSLDAALAAVIQQLSQPRQFRTWHGRVAGFIPYDFRRPTLRRILDAFWAPDNPRLFTDTALGIGWSINLAQLPRVLSGASRPRSERAYQAPKIEIRS
jgi:hypothetical protein